MASSANIGLIGYGTAGSVFHAPLITATAGLELSAIVTTDDQRAAAAQARYPRASIVASVAELWECDLDAVVIATPNTSHAQLALQAISHGLAVVVDKPLAITPDQAAEVIDAAREAGVPLTVFQNRRWDGDYLTVADLVKSGAFGTVARFESRFERFRPQIKVGWRERVSPAEGGGLLFDLGAHLIDQAVALFGAALEVYAEVDTTRPEAQTDDDVFVALTHAHGVRSHLFMSAIAADTGPRFRVLGDRAGYHVDGMDIQEAALRRGEVPGPGWGAATEADWGVLSDATGSRPVPTRDGDYPAFYRQFAATLLSGSPLPVNPGDAVNVLRIIDAAREFSTTRTVVRL